MKPFKKIHYASDEVSGSVPAFSFRGRAPKRSELVLFLPPFFFMLTSKLSKFSKPIEVNPSNREQPKSNHSYYSFVFFSEMNEISKYILPLPDLLREQLWERETCEWGVSVCYGVVDGRYAFRIPSWLLPFPSGYSSHRYYIVANSVALIGETQKLCLNQIWSDSPPTPPAPHDTDVCTVFTTVIF